MEYFLWPLWEYFVAPIANQSVYLQDHIHAGKITMRIKSLQRMRRQDENLVKFGFETIRDEILLESMVR